MKYFSTRNKNLNHSFKEVFLRGLAPDGGLFIPQKIKIYNSSELKELSKLKYTDLATEIISNFCVPDIEKTKLKELIERAYKRFNLEDVVAIKKVGNLNLLELYHGPTLAFKDIAMQVIGNIYNEFNSTDKKIINIIVATSGDTGSAAISALSSKPNINVFVLHPHNKISHIQRKIMTVVDSKNIHNIALKGNFDDCQKIVKEMFTDNKFREDINMSGVNSINWARIACQIVYYFYSSFKFQNKKINFSVPTGNFGDIYAGYVAKKMGLPINKLIVATNENDILNRFMKSGVYESKTVIKTSSPSMDIQVASNFERLLFDILNQSNTETKVSMENFEESGKISISEENLEKVREVFSSNSSSMDIVQNTIKSVKDNFSYVIDPHTATGLDASRFEKDMDRLNFVLATAHPVKFSEVVEKSIGEDLNLMSKYNYLFDAEEKMYKMENNTSRIKEFIREQIS